jgi:hypothetical protein
MFKLLFTTNRRRRPAPRQVRQPDAMPRIRWYA